MDTVDEIAVVIHDAGSGGANKLRFFCGDDTGSLIKARRELFDEKFIEFTRARLHHE